MGASAVKQELIRRLHMSPEQVIIVWSSMMSGDDYAGARKVTAEFGNRATQFWDPNNEVGREYRTSVFPNAYEDVKASLPEDSWMHTVAGLEHSFTTRPEWDIFMFFAPGVRWETTPPEPTRFIRHIGRRTFEDAGSLSVMWVDTYRSAPVRGELSNELGNLADDMLGDPSTK